MHVLYLNLRKITYTIYVRCLANLTARNNFFGGHLNNRTNCSSYKFKYVIIKAPFIIATSRQKCHCLTETTQMKAASVSTKNEEIPLYTLSHEKLLHIFRL